MEKTYRVHIYNDKELVDKWKINEKQRKIIYALMDRGLFPKDINFEFEEDHYKDFT